MCSKNFPYFSNIVYGYIEPYIHVDVHVQCKCGWTGYSNYLLFPSIILYLYLGKVSNYP